MTDKERWNAINFRRRIKSRKKVCKACETAKSRSRYSQIVITRYLSDSLENKLTDAGTAITDDMSNIIQ